MADTLEDLAARCESATGPDRELDCLIYESRFPELTPAMRGMYYGEPTGEYFLEGETTFDAPNYTASLDAAMLLVPDGYMWGAGSWGNPDTNGPWAWCDTKQNSKDNDLDYGKAATPALALCAAALRAIAKERG